MTEQDTPRKLLGAPAMKLRIAAGGLVVLLLGAWLAPAPSSTALSAPQEHAAPLLEEQVQSREARPFEGVQDAGARVRHFSVAIPFAGTPGGVLRNDFFDQRPSTPAPAGFGVFVSTSHILTHAAALGGRTEVDLSVDAGSTTRARVVVYEPTLGLVLLSTDPPASRSPVSVAATPPAAGALAVAVGHADGVDFTVPVFVTEAPAAAYRLGPVHGYVYAGMPVFNLAGELWALTAPNGSTAQGIAVRDVVGPMLARAASGDDRSSTGLSFQPLTGTLTSVFGSEGVLVSEVVPGGPADSAGAKPGDVLLSAGTATIDSVDAAAQALASAAPDTVIVLRLRRNGRERRADVTAARAYVVAALAASNGVAEPAPEARAVFDRPVLLNGAGIPHDARVLTINGRPVASRAETARVLRLARAPVPVLLRHAGHAYFVVVEPVR